jgi:hypothetical protein
MDESAYYYQHRYYKRDRGLAENKTRQLDVERQEEVVIAN